MSRTKGTSQNLPCKLLKRSPKWKSYAWFQDFRFLHLLFQKRLAGHPFISSRSSLGMEQEEALLLLLWPTLLHKSLRKNGLCGRIYRKEKTT